MVDEALRRKLNEAFDPGPAFPSAGLLSRTMASLGKEPKAMPRRYPLMNLVALGFLLLLAVGLLELRIHLVATSSKSHPTTVAPKEITHLRSPRLGPGVSWIVVNGVVGNSTLYLSPDGGRSWHPALALPGLFADLRYVKFFGTQQGVVVAETGSLQILYETHDAGGHWERELLPAQSPLGSCFNDAKHGWVIGAPGPGANEAVFKTADGGRSWTPAIQIDDAHGFRSGERVWDFDCWGSAAVGVLTTEDNARARFHYSADAGATWAVSDLTGSPSVKSGTGRFWSADGHAIVPFADFSGPSFSVYTSTDGGRTWLGPRQMPSSLALTSMALGGRVPSFAVSDGSPPAWWAMVGDHLYLSADGGRHWSEHRIPLPHGYQVVSGDFVSGSRGSIVASDAGPSTLVAHDVLLATDDGGANWYQVTTP